MSEAATRPAAAPTLAGTPVPILRLEGIRRRFVQGNAALDVLKGIDLELPPGRLMALVGPSGSGKSTLLHIAGLLERPSAGEVVIDGRPCSRLPDGERTRLRRERIGFVYQFHHLLPDFTALENVMLPQLLAGRSRARDGVAPPPPARPPRGGGGGAPRGPPRPPRPVRPPDAPSRPPVRRGAAARRHRPGARQRPGPDPGRRADRQPRPRHLRDRVRRAGPGRPRDGHGRPHRHPQPRPGGPDGRDLAARARPPGAGLTRDGPHRRPCGPPLSRPIAPTVVVPDGGGLLLVLRDVVALRLVLRDVPLLLVALGHVSALLLLLGSGHLLLLPSVGHFLLLIPTALIGDQFRPLAAGDRGEPVGRRRQPVPGVAAGRDNGLVVRPDAMAQFVLSQVLPHVLDRVQLGAVARQRQEGDVPGDGEAVGRVPARPVEHDHAVRPGRDVAADLGQVQAGGRGVGVGQDEGGTDGPLRTDRAEQVGPRVATVAGRPGPGAAPRPDPGQRALLADAGLILEPDLDRLAAGVLGQRLAYQLGEAFLNASCAASSAFGCLGLTDRRAKPSRRSTLPTERSCSRTVNRVSIRAWRSTRRQRTTPSRSGSGPRSTAVASSASCSGVSRGLGPGRRRSLRPSSPSSLYRCTQSCKVCRSMPAARAASSREAPSSTSARASIRRAARASRHRPASRRSSPAPSSRRVTATVMAPPPIGYTTDQRPRAARGATDPTVRSRGRWYYYLRNVMS